jgi:hypothetical protein
VTLIHRGSGETGGAQGPLVYIDLPLIDKHAVAGHIMDQMVAMLPASNMASNTASNTPSTGTK